MAKNASRREFCVGSRGNLRPIWDMSTKTAVVERENSREFCSVSDLKDHRMKERSRKTEVIEAKKPYLKSNCVWSGGFAKCPRS